jgi:hypothetical protein
MVSISLPFFASNIPGPLPTKLEIDGAPVLMDHNGYKVVRVGIHFVVKYGGNHQLDLIEGENMLFIQSVTRVKVPQVYALYTDHETSTNYIVMEYIEGSTLREQWLSLTIDQKQEIISTLRRYFDQLRNLPSPGYYGSLDRRPLLDGIFWTTEPDPSINGPFDSEDDLNNGLSLKYTREAWPRTHHKQDFYRRSLANVFQNHKPRFTHGDFQQKNIMVRLLPTGQDDINQGDRFEVTLIDWEKSGWYPSYWEYSMATCSTRWDDDWDAWVPKVLEPFDAEYPWLKMLYLDLWS